LIVEKLNGDISAHTSISNGTPKVVVNDVTNDHHVEYNLQDKNDGHHQGQRLDLGIVEDETYATMHPIQNAYDALSKHSAEEEIPQSETMIGLEDILESSLGSAEGNDDHVAYIRVSDDDSSRKGDNIINEESEDNPSM